jgi:hypothetical protein
VETVDGSLVPEPGASCVLGGEVARVLAVVADTGQLVVDVIDAGAAHLAQAVGEFGLVVQQLRAVLAPVEIGHLFHHGRGGGRAMVTTGLHRVRSGVVRISGRGGFESVAE